jgi:hypothetical protein
MHKSQLTVVIPLRLEEPTELEQISLKQILTVLHRHPIALMVPTSLDVGWYEDFCQGHDNVRFERFDWHGYDAFVSLMVDPEFYRRFINYKYMLIHHLDAFVFRDELEKWCAQDYDYIGAVVYNPGFMNKKDTVLRRLSGFSNPEYFGNGGFALKKVATFLRITSRFKFYISAFHVIRKWRKHGFFDDLFLAQHFPKLSPSFRIAPKAVAQQFGADSYDWEEEEIPFTNRENKTLPFGVHGWIQHNREFWEPCIRRYGYNL